MILSPFRHFFTFLLSPWTASKLLPPTSEVLKFRKFFETTDFKKFNHNVQKGCNYFIEALDLRNDYLTAFMAVEKNPQSISLFSKKLQKDYESRSGVFKTLSPAKEKSLEMVTIKKVSANLNPIHSLPVLKENSLAIVPYKKPFAGLYEEQQATQYEHALRRNFEALKASHYFLKRFEKEPEQEEQTTIFKELSPAQSVKIEQRNAVEESSQAQVVDPKIRAMAKAKWMNQQILALFPQKDRAYAWQVLKNPHPVLKTLIENCSETSKVEKQEWLYVIKANICMQRVFKQCKETHESVKSSFLVSQDFDKGAKKFLEHPHTQNFIQDSIFKGHDVNLILKSVHSSWTIHLGKKVFLEQFDLEEKTAAESILNHPRNRKMIWELAFNGSGFSEEQITSSLNEKFKNQVLKLTIRNQIEQRFKSDDLDFVKTLFKPGSKYENSYNIVLNSCKKSRAVMRLMLLSTLSEAVRNKSKPSLEIQMKLEILKTITQNTPQVDFLDLIFTSQQKAQCSLHELKKLKQDIYVIKAQKALETNSVDPLLDIPEEELFKLPKDLLGKLEHARLIEEYLEL